MLFQVGHFIVTTASLPALCALSAFLGTCGWLSIRRRSFGLADLPFVLVLTAIQTIAAIFFVPVGGSGIGVFTLSWPFLGFLVGYGIWRVAGGMPLRHWPWHRFGLMAGLTIFTVDVAIGVIMPVAPGHAWVLGGAGALDALTLLPPVLTLIYWGLLDCSSPMVFCCKECRTANQCRAGLGVQHS